MSGLEQESSIARLEADPPEFDQELVLGSILNDPHLSQHLIRKREADHESIVLYRRLQFVAGQQHEVVHLQIEPALDNVPQVEVLCLSEYLAVDETNPGQVEIAESSISSARTKVTDRQRYGIRAEISLGQPAAIHFSFVVEIVIESRQ